MADITYLILEDGSTFSGSSFGSEKLAYGEVVFNTSMTGYQEMLTDPSYAGQIVVPTYPMMGNYGISSYHQESSKVQVSGFVVRQFCTDPSHIDSSSNIADFLHDNGITGISEVDTRAITRRIRKNGVMMGVITDNPNTSKAIQILKNLPEYDQVDHVESVSTKSIYKWTDSLKNRETSPETLKILVSDYGLKYNILRILKTKGCEIQVFPSDATADELLERAPDGIMLSPGPGDPNLIDYTVQTTKDLLGRVPIMGICLGNQILGRAIGAKTYKLKFGHRGANHPVKELSTGRIHITAQNHGYAIDPESLSSEAQITHLSMNDETVEGIRHRSLPAMSIQYHSEASPGPLDNEYIFNSFLEMIEDSK